MINVMKKFTAEVVDTNNRPIGVQVIELDIEADIMVHQLVMADGRHYVATGKSGTSNGHAGAAPAGTMMWELATSDDARAWVDLAGSYVHLD